MEIDALKAYVRTIQRNIARGDATEHTHRPALKALLEAIGGEAYVVTNEPKRVACGAPDFNVSRGNVPIGYIECKDPGTNLSAQANSKQIKI